MARKKKEHRQARMLFTGVCIVVAIVLVVRSSSPKSITPDTSTQSAPAEQSSPYTGTVSAAVFVPYWKISEGSPLTVPQGQVPSEIRPLFFGISVTDQGDIDTSESGFSAHAGFERKYGTRDAGLVIRLLNQEQNSMFLQTKMIQSSVIDSTIRFAKDHGYSELIIDLEITALPLESTKDAVTAFLRDYLKAIQAAHLRSGVLLYGDVYFRARPFDTERLFHDADTVYLMLYDLHKSRGEPGPNFPLEAAQNDYSLMRLTSDIGSQDYSKIVPVFGMYGYDWKIDTKRRSLKPATAYTYAHIQDSFIHSCPVMDCSLRIDAQSRESVVTYTEADGYKHEVWFETPLSIEQKIEYLKKLGVRSYAIWAGGYY